MRSQSWMIFWERRLLYCDNGVLRFVVWIPFSLKIVEWSFLQPKLSPFVQSEVFYGKEFSHLINKILKNSILEGKLSEISWKSLWKVFLLHDEEELLHRGGTFGICDSIEDWVSYTCIGNWPSDRMSGHSLIFVVSPTFPVQKWGHTGLIFDCGKIWPNFFKTKMTNKICKAFVKP